MQQHLDGAVLGLKCGNVGQPTEESVRNRMVFIIKLKVETNRPPCREVIIYFIKATRLNHERPTVPPPQLQDYVPPA